MTIKASAHVVVPEDAQLQALASFVAAADAHRYFNENPKVVDSLSKAVSDGMKLTDAEKKERDDTRAELLGNQKKIEEAKKFLGTVEDQAAKIKKTNDDAIHADNVKRQEAADQFAKDMAAKQKSMDAYRAELDGLKKSLDARKDALDKQQEAIARDAATVKSNMADLDKRDQIRKRMEKELAQRIAAQSANELASLTG